ncbi:MAG TPA: hypothetical protein PKE47_16550 [Verrucomicrobiota bacterium]|nr:hypothetical protein [Verrucomicrobiota bacterium]
MDLDYLRALVKATPFVPFRLRLADGTEKAVARRDFLLLPPFGRRVELYEGGPEHWTVHVVNLDQVVEIVIEGEPAVAT